MHAKRLEGPSAAPITSRGGAVAPERSGEAAPARSPATTREPAIERATLPPKTTERSVVSNIQGANKDGVASASSAFNMLVRSKKEPPAAAITKKTDRAELRARAPSGPRDPFLSETERKLADFTARGKVFGLTREQSLELYGIAGGGAADPVTGFEKAEHRVSTLVRAIEHVATTGETAIYVEADIRNLGGLNHALGHSGANEVFKAITDIVAGELGKLGADVCKFRHGGDEISAVVVSPSITKDDVDAAMTRARRRVQSEVVRPRGLSALEHPKHKDNPSLWGVGIVFGTARVMPDDFPNTVFRAADQEVEANKLKR